MERYILNLLALLFVAFLLTAVSYGIALLLRSKYTPITLRGETVAKTPLFLGLGLIGLSMCCIMPISCVDAMRERDQAIKEYKEQIDSQHQSGDWYYGKLYPDRSVSRSRGIWEVPASINAMGDELRFTYMWKENGTISRTTSFSGKRVRHDTHTVYQGTWFVTNTKREGEWTLFKLSDDYYSGWLRSKGDEDKDPIFLRKDR